MLRVGGVVACYAGVLLALAACGESGTPASSSAGGSGAGTAGVNLGTASVHVTAGDDLLFSPASQDAQVGAVVQWSNSGSALHSVTFDSFTSLSDVSLQAGSTWEVKFTSPGTYSYRCTFHPTMTGTITVH